MYSIEKLEKILNEKVYSIEETSYGVTNNNFRLIKKSDWWKKSVRLNYIQIYKKV